MLLVLLREALCNWLPQPFFPLKSSQHTQRLTHTLSDSQWLIEVKTGDPKRKD